VRRFKDVYLRMQVDETEARKHYEEYLLTADEPVTWTAWWDDWVTGIIEDLQKQMERVGSIERDVH
jgi:hypothetical protein